jgi:hypothetical protein
MMVGISETGSSIEGSGLRGFKGENSGELW